jgi:hypothetical protein
VAIQYDFIPRALGGKRKLDARQEKVLHDVESSSREASALVGPIKHFESLLRIGSGKSARILTNLVLSPKDSSSVKLNEAQFFDIENRYLRTALEPASEVFGIVAMELGSMPFRSSLQDTIVLSEQPETQALRDFVNERLTNAPLGEKGDLEELKREIDNAGEKFIAADQRDRASRIMTYVGVPIGVLGFLDPVVGLLGLGMSLVGFYATVRNQRELSSVRWAMFGKKALPPRKGA